MKHVATTLVVLAAVHACGVSFAQDESKIPKEVQEELQFFVGSWTFVAYDDGEISKGQMKQEWAKGKYCVHGSVNADDGSISFNFVSGWDVSTGWTAETGVGADGGVYTVRWTRTSPDVSVGALVATFEGKIITGSNTLKKNRKEGSFTVDGVRIIDGKEKEWHIKFTRAKPPKTSRQAKK